MTEGKGLAEIERKAFRESLQDGLMEAMIGIILIGMAAASGHIVFVAVYLIPLLFWRPISEAIRRRYTYPRIGYYRLRSDPAKKVLPGVFLYQILVFILIGITLFVIFGDITDPGLWFRAMPLIFALMLVGAFLHTAGKTGSRRPYLYSMISLVIASVLSTMEFEGLNFPYLFGEFGAGLVLFFIFMGSLLLIIGALQFFSFLRSHPMAPDSALVATEVS